MIIFSPWAFGTTQLWSIWSMNVVGYLLGVFLAIKLFIRCVKGYQPPRWDQPSESGATSLKQKFLTPAQLSKVLAVLTIAILLYCLVSAVNAAATHDPDALNFTYHRYIRWLPHSFDSGRTWLAFWTYLSLSLSFWAIVDWLPGKSGGEERANRQRAVAAPHGESPLFPTRLRRLLWVLCVNGALVGVEGIFQRIEGSGRLLFLIKPTINSEAISQFGPYHYRANASAFFNLIWPVCLGFWWTLHRSSNSRKKAYHLLLVCGLVMAACPIISTSRGGALITAAIIILTVFFFCVLYFVEAAQRRKGGEKQKSSFAFILFFFAGALALGLSLGWKSLKPRLGQIQEGFDGREEMYDAARPMARDYPFFGTGPGTFESVFQLYRISTETYWPAQLHNDWLETRITFGGVGGFLIGGAFLAVILRWFTGGGLQGGQRFMILMWLSLGGCLLHARFDFPFQIYSTHFLFLLLCAVAFSLSRKT
jgi:hypothetical protein